MMENFFAAIEPESHLGEFVLTIGGSIRMLGHVDVEPFGVLHIRVVRSAQLLGKVTVMPNNMEFGDVEMRPYSEANKNLNIFAELSERLI